MRARSKEGQHEGIPMKMDFSELGKSSASPAEHGQDLCEHIRSGYSAEQQLQIGHSVISAGKFFIKTLR